MRRAMAMLLIFVATLLIGIIFIMFNPLPYGDQTDYDIQAKNILNGRGFSLSSVPPFYPDVYRTPGTAFFLCGIYSLFGNNYLIVRIIQAILNAAVPVIIFLLCEKVFTMRFSYLVGFITAFYPLTTLFVPVISSEILCVFLFVLGVFLFETGRNLLRVRYFIFSGITFGLCLLVRPGTALMPFFMGVTYMMIEKFSKVRRYLLSFFIAFLLVWSPWVVRNYLVTKRFIPLTIESREMVYWATGSIGKYFEDRMYNPKFRSQIAEIERIIGNLNLSGVERTIKEQELYSVYARKNIIDNPFKYVFSTMLRIPRMWISYVTTDTGRSYQIGVGTSALYWLVAFFTALTFLLGIYGMWLLRHSWKDTAILYVPIIYFCLTHMVFLTEARYTLPARPFLMVFVVFAVLKMLNFILKRAGLKTVFVDLKGQG